MTVNKQLRDIMTLSPKKVNDAKNEGFDSFDMIIIIGKCKLTSSDIATLNMPYLHSYLFKTT